MEYIAILLHKKIKQYDICNIILQYINSDENYNMFETYNKLVKNNKLLQEILQDEEELYANYLYENINTLNKKTYKIFNDDNVIKLTDDYYIAKFKSDSTKYKYLVKIIFNFDNFTEKIKKIKDYDDLEYLFTYSQIKFIKTFCSLEFLNNMYIYIHMIIKMKYNIDNLIEDNDIKICNLMNELIDYTFLDQINSKRTFFIKEFLKLHKLYQFEDYYPLEPDNVLYKFENKIRRYKFTDNIELNVIFHNIIKNTFKIFDKSKLDPIYHYIIS